MLQYIQTVGFKVYDCIENQECFSFKSGNKQSLGIVKKGIQTKLSEEKIFRFAQHFKVTGLLQVICDFTFLLKCMKFEIVMRVK